MWYADSRFGLETKRLERPDRSGQQRTPASARRLHGHCRAAHATDQRWSKADIQAVQDALKQACSNSAFESPIPDLWYQRTIDAINKIVDGGGWCNCNKSCCAVWTWTLVVTFGCTDLFKQGYFASNCSLTFPYTGQAGNKQSCQDMIDQVKAGWAPVYTKPSPILAIYNQTNLCTTPCTPPAGIAAVGVATVNYRRGCRRAMQRDLHPHLPGVRRFHHRAAIRTGIGMGPGGASSA